MYMSHDASSPCRKQYNDIMTSSADFMVKIRNEQGVALMAYSNNIPSSLSAYRNLLFKDEKIRVFLF